MSKSVSSGYGGIKNQHLKQENMKKKIEDRLNKWVSEEYEWLLGEISTNIAYGRMSSYASDLLHHIILDLYKMNPAKIEGMLDNGKLKWYVLRGASLQIRSQTSPFYRIHRKEKTYARSGLMDSGKYDTETYELDDPDVGEDLYECFKRAMAEIHWYQKTLLEKKIIEGKTYQEIYEYYNISKTHLIRDINEALRDVRLICKNIK